MPDRENVISRIKTICEMCKENKWMTEFTSDVIYPILSDALALLKEQETKWIHRSDMDYKDKNGVVHFHGMCESCGFIHDFIDGHTGQYKFCPECGRSVKWE